MARHSAGHTNLLAVLTPNLAVKPATVLITKVTIKGMKQAVQMFGPAQAAVAKAVADSVADGIIRADQAKISSSSAASSSRRRRRTTRNPQVQLRGHEAVHPARHEAASPPRPRSSRARTGAQHPFKGF